MPLLNQAPVGEISTSAASESQFEDFDNVTATFTWPVIGLYVPQLPHLCFYALFQTDNGATNLSITPQFSVSSLGGAGAPRPLWLDLAGPVVCPLGTPILLNYNYPAALIRMNVTLGGGAPDANFRLTLGAYGG